MAGRSSFQVDPATGAVVGRVAVVEAAAGQAAAVILVAAALPEIGESSQNLQDGYVG